MANVPIEYTAPVECITSERVELSMMLFPAPLIESIARNENDLQDLIDIRNAMIDNGFRASRILEHSVDEAEHKRYSSYVRVFIDARKALRDIVLERSHMVIDVNVK